MLTADTNGQCGIHRLAQDVYKRQVYSLTLTGVAESWLLGEIRETPEELVAFINQMLQDHVRGARMR